MTWFRTSSKAYLARQCRTVEAMGQHCIKMKHKCGSLGCENERFSSHRWIKRSKLECPKVAPILAQRMQNRIVSTTLFFIGGHFQSSKRVARKMAEFALLVQPTGAETVPMSPPQAACQNHRQKDFFLRPLADGHVKLERRKSGSFSHKEVVLLGKILDFCASAKGQTSLGIATHF